MVRAYPWHNIAILIIIKEYQIMFNFKKVKITCASLSLLGCVASANAAIISDSSTGLLSPDITIDFGVGLYADNTVITNQFSTQGITFDGPSTRYLGSINQGSYSVDGAVAGLNGDNLAEPDSMLFSSDVTDVAFTFKSNPSNTTFTAYLDGVEQESFVAYTAYNGEGSNVYYGFTDILLDEISYSISYKNNYFVLDNLQFNTKVVPAPAALSIFGLGLMGLGLRRFKKQA
jgi:hypothetical protein